MDRHASPQPASTDGRRRFGVTNEGPFRRADASAEPVRVWRLRLERDAARIAAWRAALPAEEQVRAARFRQPDDVARFVVGRHALRRILAVRLGLAPQAVPLVPGPNGKPILAPGPSPWEFNLSHSGDWILIALAWRRRVGIDVEAWRDLEYATLAERAFAPEERAALAAVPEVEQAATFFAVWTRKEAVLKARALGLGAFPLEDFAVEAAVTAPEPRLLRWQGEEVPDHAWRLFTVPVAERCSACLAVERVDGDPRWSLESDLP